MITVKRIMLAIVATCIWITPTIAQPNDYMDDFITPQAPQNYLYEELPDIKPYYNLNNYKKWDIIESKIIHYKDTLGFTPGNCTIYVAHKRRDLFHGQGDNAFVGNAKTRLTQAKKQGLVTGNEPKPGAIAVFAPNKGAGSEGHVAYVEEVGDNGLIVISDMNARGKFVVTTRVVPANLAQAYIY